MSTRSPDSARGFEDVRLSQLPEACRVMTDAQLDHYIANCCFGAPHHRMVAEREALRRKDAAEETHAEHAEEAAR